MQCACKVQSTHKLGGFGGMPPQKKFAFLESSEVVSEPVSVNYNNKQTMMKYNTNVVIASVNH